MLNQSGIVNLDRVFPYFVIFNSWSTWLDIPDDSGKKSGMDWVLPKIIGSGIGYPSGTDYIVFGGT